MNLVQAEPTEETVKITSTDETVKITSTPPSKEIQKLLDRSMSPTMAINEQHEITKQLNDLGIPTTNQLHENPEKWTQMVLEKALEENKEQGLCRRDCANNNNMVFFPGFFYDCGRLYQCSNSVSYWASVDQKQSRAITFNMKFSENSPSVTGWYYAKATTGTSNADWTDIFSVYPAGFERLHNYDENASSSKLKMLETVNNNRQSSRIGFVFSVHSVT